MKNTYAFTAYYLKIFLRNRKAAAAMWLAPIFFLFGAALIGSSLLKEDARVEPFKAAIVNEDHTMETKMVIKQLTDSGHLNRVIKTDIMSAEKAEQLLRENKIAAIIHIPEGFSSDVAKGENTPVRVVGNPQRPLESQLVRHLLESAADFTSAAQSGINTVYYFMEDAELPKGEKRAQYKRDLVSFSLHILGRGEIFEEHRQENLFQESLYDYYAISFYILCLMIWTYLCHNLLKEKAGVAVQARLSAMGYTALQSLAGKWAAVSIFVFFGAMLIGVPYLIWKDGSVPGPVFIGGTLLIVFAFASLFTLTGALIKNDRLNLLANMLVILLGAIIGEHLIPAVYYPEWLLQLNAFSLNGWALKFMFAIVQGGPVLKWTGILIASSCICLLIAAIRLKFNREGIRG